MSRSSGSPASPSSSSRGAAFLDALLSRPSFDKQALEGVADVAFPAPGRCTCRFPVRAEARNRYGTLHGGCVATLVDVISTAALVTVSDSPGVSADLSVSYLRPGPGGEDVDVDARVLKVGRALAFMEVTISDARGRVVAKGSHTKFLPPRQAAEGESAGDEGAAGERSGASEGARRARL